MGQSDHNYEEILNEFVERYQLDHGSVINYRRISRVSNLAITVIGLSVATIFYSYVLIRAFPDFILTNLFTAYPISAAAVVVGILGIVGVYVARAAMNNYTFGKGDVVYHFLAMSVSKYFDGNYEQSLSNLSTFASLAEKDRTARIHAMRLGVLNDYIHKLSSAEQMGDLQSTIENTFVEFVGEICRKIYDTMEETQLIQIVVNMDVQVDDSPSWRETIGDLIDPLTSQSFIEYAVFLVLILVVLIVGIIESPGWGMVILALYLAYKA